MIMHWTLLSLLIFIYIFYFRLFIEIPKCTFNTKGTDYNQMTRSVCLSAFCGKGTLDLIIVRLHLVYAMYDHTLQTCRRDAVFMP